MWARRGKPTDNSYIDTFNGSSRDECLNLYRSEPLPEARQEIEAWRQDDGENWPYVAPNDLTPGEFARKFCLRQQVGGS